MEFVNKVELRGIVGRSESQAVQGKICTKFSLVTNYTYKMKDGTTVVETVWHNVLKWFDENDVIPRRGDWWHVRGRIHAATHVDADGMQRTITDIIADTAEKIEKDETDDRD